MKDQTLTDDDIVEVRSTFNEKFYRLLETCPHPEFRSELTDTFIGSDSFIHAANLALQMGGSIGKVPASDISDYVISKIKGIKYMRIQQEIENENHNQRSVLY